LRPGKVRKVPEGNNQSRRERRASLKGKGKGDSTEQIQNGPSRRQDELQTEHIKEFIREKSADLIAKTSRQSRQRAFVTLRGNSVREDLRFQ